MDRINKLLGLELMADEISQILESLGIDVSVEGETMTVYSTCGMILRNGGFGRGVARIYGYAAFIP